MPETDQAGEQHPDVVWMDGELVPFAEANVHVLSNGLLYGAGVFEGVRCHATDRGPAVFRLDDHLRRLNDSMRIYLAALPHPVEVLAHGVIDTVRANGYSDCYVRPIVWMGPGLDPLAATLHTAIACWPWENYHAGADTAGAIRVKVSSFSRVDANAMPTAAKATGQYLNTFLAKVDALLAGYDEAVLLNSGGMVADGTAENVFAVRDGVITTPPTVDGALGGITRDTVIVLARALGYEVREASLRRSDLYVADEVFLTGTAAGVAPVRDVDGRPPAAGAPGPATQALRRLYADVVGGRVSDWAHWLHYVDGGPVGRGDCQHVVDGALIAAPLLGAVIDERV
ncbi:MAG TPA: branched-chain amino acid transaminase [Acidimicrobiales bacterium]|nr:branched-chain amino acid transaminase [Acidimicrobiales bacterium]